jgi:hypothetical protein
VDDDLKVLRQLTTLGFLSLNRTQITDAGLAHLQGMRSLSGLFVVGTGVTEEGIAALKKATPTLQFLDTN